MDDDRRIQALVDADGNVAAAARALGLHRTTLLEWIEVRQARGVELPVRVVSRVPVTDERRARALREAQGNVCFAARLLGEDECSYWRWERRARAKGLLSDIPADRACRVCHARGVAGTVHNAPCGLVCGSRYGHRGTGHCPRCNPG